MTLEDEIKKAIEGQVKYYDLSSEENEEVQKHLKLCFESLNEAIAKKIKSSWKKAKGLRERSKLLPS
jgi:hypothetical protein